MPYANQDADATGEDNRDTLADSARSPRRYSRDFPSATLAPRSGSALLAQSSSARCEGTRVPDCAGWFAAHITFHAAPDEEPGNNYCHDDYYGNHPRTDLLLQMPHPLIC